MMADRVNHQAGAPAATSHGPVSARLLAFQRFSRSAEKGARIMVDREEIFNYKPLFLTRLIRSAEFLTDNRRIVTLLYIRLSFQTAPVTI